MNKAELAGAFSDICFPLSDKTRLGGRIHYFTPHIYLSDPNLVKETAKQLVDLVPENTQVIVGVGNEGNIFGSALSQETGLSYSFTEPDPDNDGFFLFRGAIIQDRRVLLVKSDVTSGASIVKAADNLRHHRVPDDEVVNAISVFEYGFAATRCYLTRHNINFRSLFNVRMLNRAFLHPLLLKSLENS